MKDNFFDYIKENFNFDESEFEEFKSSIDKPLKKSIRINTNKISISDFKTLAKEKWWTLTPSPNWENMVYIDRERDLKTALGSTFEHISWLFYVQEVAASTSPFVMSWDKVDEGEYVILDVSASPGGKTTQLAEYYPNSLIVANEFDKPRIKQLFTNIERMWSLNIWVTNYDWRYFKGMENVFDKILLDAPCSGEGTCYKGTEAVKYWNIKNIKAIAKLQFWLVEGALRALKVWGEVVYSTCTLNKLENEDLVEKIKKKYWEYIEIIPVSEENVYKRLWPHKDKTGGFFVARIKKINDLPERNNKKIEINNSIEKLSKKEEKAVLAFIEEHFGESLPKLYFYKQRDEVYASEKNFWELFDKLFFFKVGAKVWEFDSWVFRPSYYLWNLYNFTEKVYNIKDEEELDKYLRGYDLDYSGELSWLIAIKWNGFNLWIAEIKDSQIKNYLPTKLVRK